MEFSRPPVRSLILVAALIGACSGESPQSLVASGRALADKGDHAAAVLQYKNAIQADPRALEARVLLAESLIKLADFPAAAVELGKALDADGDKTRVLPQLSRALLMSGQYRKLVDTYGQVDLADKAAQATLKTNVAAAWGALGDRAKTEAALAAALAADAKHEPAQILRARIVAGKGDFDGAARIVDEVLARAPKMTDAWLLKGELLNFAQKDADGAVAAFRKALDLEPAHVGAHMAIIANRLRMRDVAAARAQADALRARQPQHPYTILADTQLAFLDGKSEKAREIVQPLLKAFPESPGVLILAGAVEAQLGSLELASKHFGKAMSVNPSLDVPRLNLAEVEIRQGQFTKALATLAPLLSANPPAPAALSLAGDAEARRGNADSAERYFVAAARRDPGNVKVQTAAAVSRLAGRDPAAALADLRGLAEKSADTYADEALLAVHMKRREYDKALQVLERMQKKAPGKAAHLDMLGRLHLARKDYPAARAAFEKALSLDPALFASVSSLAMLDVVEGQQARAVERLQAAIKANPKNAAAMMALADLRQRYGADAAEVRGILASAVAAAPDWSAPRLRMIELAVERRQFKEALASAQEAVAALPSDAAVIDAAGRAQARAGDVEQALSTFRRLATLQPTAAEPYLRLVELYMASGKREQAETAAAKALELAPESGAVHAAFVNVLISADRQRQAKEYIERFRKSKPTEPVGYLLEAQFHARQRNADAAVAVLQEGLKNTGRSEIARSLHSVLLQAARPGDAERFADAWFKQHPKDQAFEYQMAVADLAQGRNASAEKHLQSVLAAYPRNALALNNLAWVLIQQGRGGAVDLAQKAVDIHPSNPALLDTLAQAFLAEKKPVQAMEIQRKAVELSPENNHLRLTLARAAVEAGDKTVARQELARLKDLGQAFSDQAEVARLSGRL